jgi:hypothetical protein
VWVSLKEPSGGYLDGRDYNLYVSNTRPEAQIPIPAGAGFYAFGKVTLVPDVDRKQAFVYFDGGLHTTDGTEKVVRHVAVAKIEGIIAP